MNINRPLIPLDIYLLKIQKINEIYDYLRNIIFLNSNERVPPFVTNKYIPKPEDNHINIENNNININIKNSSDINEETDSNNKTAKTTDKIFIINKNKNKGRRRRNIFNLYRAKHNKFSKDNLIQKIKRQFVNSTMKLINKLYKKFCEEQNLKPIKLLQKINPKFSMLRTYENSFSYMQRSTAEMFSENLSEKVTKYDKNYNGILIKKIYEENKAKEVIELLNYSIKEMYEIYIGKSDHKIYQYGLEYDLIKIKENNKEDKYEETYRNIALNLLYIFSRKRQIKINK